ncbi:MAG TPA: dehydrogenase [Solibacterales bacterium]|nr:dehydrogenase [Bryobacterales bacterium]
MTPTSAERTDTEVNLTAAPTRLAGLSPEALVRAYRWMYLSRRIDDREILLKRQNKIFFQISAAGHEAAQVAAGMCLQPGHDWFYPYYRDRALCLALGVTPQEMFLQAFGAAADTASGGRQMPSHWSDYDKHIVAGSSPTGTQYLQAIGCAEACVYQNPAAHQVTLVSSGEGATSEGEFWEAINAACLRQLPVVFLIQDNGYAISVPVDHQTPGGNISRLLSGFPNLFRQEVDGTNFPASHAAMSQAVAYCREGHGPALVHAHVVRPYSHSLSDDEKLYKTPAERASEAEIDPLVIFPRQLVSEGIVDAHELARVAHEADQEVQAAAHSSDHQPGPAPATALRHLYSETVDPQSAQFASEPQFQGEPKTMVDLINVTLHEEMRRDESIVVFGQDVADCSREDSLREVKGKGGVFKVTAGLQTEFSTRRCFNAPIAEAAITGRAIGMATAGMKPVVEIQFFDYIWPAMMQIRDEMASLRWRSNGGFSCPLVMRVPIGGYLNGGAIYHSQNGESIFTHIPGIRVVFPSNALDACGLLRTAIRCDDPVLFLEHKRLYREPYNRSPHPGADFCIPFGKARLVKPGHSLTVVTYGALVQKSLQAAMQIERKNPEAGIEILDLRSLSPYDWAAVEASVKKTNRVLFVHEDCLSWGYGAEICARIADELFGDLDAPVRRIGAMDTWVGYHPDLENAILPQVDDIVREAEKLLRY